MCYTIVLFLVYLLQRFAESLPAADRIPQTEVKLCIAVDDQLDFEVTSVIKLLLLLKFCLQQAKFLQTAV